MSGMTTTSCCEIRVAASTICRQATIAYEFDGLMSQQRAGAVPENLHTDAKHIPGGRDPKLLFSSDGADDAAVYTHAAPLVAAKADGHEDDQRATSSIERSA